MKKKLSLLLYVNTSIYWYWYCSGSSVTTLVIMFFSIKTLFFNIFFKQTWKHWTNGTATELIDPSLRHESSTDIEAMRCINIALLCVQERPNERPNIFSVNLMLTRKRMQIPSPSNPAFVLDSVIEETDLGTSYTSSSTSSVKYSINEVSCTEPYPR